MLSCPNCGEKPTVIHRGSSYEYPYGYFEIRHCKIKAIGEKLSTATKLWNEKVTEIIKLRVLNEIDEENAITS